jgi:subtilisin family serine protease
MTTMRRLLPAVCALSLVAAAPAPPAPPKHTAALGQAIAAAQGQRTLAAWVFFTDKGARAEARTAEARALMTVRAQSRRALRGRVAQPTVDDMALVPAYVDRVAATVQRIRQRSRWLNAVSVEATAAQLDALEKLPFVARLDVVRAYRRGPAEPVRPDAGGPARWSAAGAARASVMALDYGSSRGQLAQIGVPAVHDLGFHGEGVVVAVFDAGFSDLSHEVFSALHIAATRDFVNGDENVADGRDQGEGSHGTMTLSVLGGLREGELVGPAFAADFILAKTENTDSETPVEEDNWAAAAEWAESLGADVISSSLGYLDYDSPFADYTFANMDGRTAISTRAAEMAAERGVVVVNSAGNSGSNRTHNTLGAPADGAHVLAIGAVDARGLRASFSSVGPTADGRIKPDLAAQGVDVKVAYPGSVSRYGLADGTSFSCPLTAGVVALLLQVNPGATPDDIAGVLRSTAGQRARVDNLLGWGIVNAEAAVQAWLPRETSVR